MYRVIDPERERYHMNTFKELVVAALKETALYNMIADTNKKSLIEQFVKEQCDAVDYANNVAKGTEAYLAADTGLPTHFSDVQVLGLVACCIQPKYVTVDGSEYGYKDLKVRDSEALKSITVKSPEALKNGAYAVLRMLGAYNIDDSKFVNLGDKRKATSLADLRDRCVGIEVTDQKVKLLGLTKDKDHVAIPVTCGSMLEEVDQNWTDKAIIAYNVQSWVESLSKKA